MPTLTFRPVTSRNLTPQLFQRWIGKLHPGDPKLTRNAEQRIRTMKTDERQIVAVALNMQVAVADGHITNAEYMFKVMESAAIIARDDPERFLHLIALVFAKRTAKTWHKGLSIKSYVASWVFEAGRTPLGGGYDAAGRFVEQTHNAYARSSTRGVDGYNANVIDKVDPFGNTITHHLVEFLRVGFHRWPILGKWAQDVIDGDFSTLVEENAQINTGDIRSGYFGTMLGDALSRGAVQPREAVALVRWAYGQHSESPPPWGTKANGAYLNWDNYNFEHWLAAFRNRRPPPIALRQP